MWKKAKYVTIAFALLLGICTFNGTVYASTDISVEVEGKLGNGGNGGGGKQPPSDGGGGGKQPPAQPDVPDKPSVDSSKPDNNTLPKTGNHTHVAFVSLGLILASSLMIAWMASRREREGEQQWFIKVVQ